MTSQQTLKNENLQNTSEKINHIFALQQDHRIHVGPSTFRQRKSKLKKLLSYILTHRSEIQEAVYKDFRKPSVEVDLSEIYVVIAEIRHAIRHLNSWMRIDRVSPSRALIGTKSFIRYEPKGIVLIISPWNFPFMLALGPVVSAIAAGNCIIAKPSELAPNTSRFIARMIADLFDENEIAVVEGDKSVAHELLKLPFDHIFFTGSTPIGKIIMQEAAKNLSTVTLELGGKSPIIVDETADLDDAVEKISWGKFFNAGQTCVAPDYMLIHRKYYDKALKLFERQIVHFYGKETGDHQSSRDYARVINEHHFKRLREWIEEAVREGAHINTGGIFDEEDRYVSPTIMTNVSLKSTIMQEEIFGPVLPVFPYDDLNSAIKLINDRPTPLALYIFSKNSANIRKTIEGTSAGGSCINDVVIQFMHQNLPFGGSNHSGFGKSHGYFGFKEFSHQRAIVRQTRFSALKLLYPPYTRKVQKLVDWVLKYL